MDHPENVIVKYSYEIFNFIEEGIALKNSNLINYKSLE